MEAPEKLYFDVSDINGILSIYSDKEPNDTIEYVRKDVVIEKTCDFIRKMVDVPLNIEKDFELTIEDIKTIDRLLNKCVDCSNPYQEVLKRFKERKER